MIKAPGRTGDGRPMLLLGLSGENMTRLMADEPIVVDVDQLGHPFAGLPSIVVVLVGGRTDRHIVEQMRTAGLDVLLDLPARRRDPSEPDPTAPCAHCPDGHRNPTSRPWGVHVAPVRDGDGQPTHLIVGPSNGAHVAESDAAWLWHLIRNA